METNNETLVNKPEKKFYQKLILIALLYLLIQLGISIAGGIILGIMTVVLQLPEETFTGTPPLWYNTIVVLLSNIISFFMAKSIVSLKMSDIKSTNAFSKDFQNGLKFTALFIGYLCLEDFFTKVVEMITSPMGFSVFDNSMKINVRDPIELISAFILTCVSAPIFEELIFRGCIMNATLKKTNNPKFAIVISAIIFGLVHTNGVTSLILIPMGLILGYTYYKTQSLVPGMIIHFFNNLIVIIQMLVLEYSSHADIILLVIDILFLLSSIIMIVLNKKNRKKLEPIEKGMIKNTLLSVPGVIFFIFVVFGFIATIHAV